MNNNSIGLVSFLGGDLGDPFVKSDNLRFGTIKI